MSRLTSAPAAAGTAAAGPPPPQARPPAVPAGAAAAAGRKHAELTLLLTPAVALFVLFVLLPICIAAYYGLFNWSGYGPLSDFTGVHNYKLVLSDPVFRGSLLHNVIIAVLSLLVQLPISIALALLLNRRIRGGTFLRLAVFAPYVLSEAVTGIVFRLLLQPHAFVDSGLSAFGLNVLIQD
jgi:raffinose/stachyose/melibiose transport system permease protein